MLNHYPQLRIDLAAALRLKYWQIVLRLTRLAAHAQRWATLFNQQRKLMALAFGVGMLLGLLPLFR